MITGCSYGVIYNKNTWWNEEIRLKEDFWISCYMKYKERKVLTDLRYNFEQKNNFVNAGGLASIRNQEEERREENVEEHRQFLLGHHREPAQADDGCSGHQRQLRRGDIFTFCHGG